MASGSTATWPRTSRVATPPQRLSRVEKRVTQWKSAVDLDPGQRLEILPGERLLGLDQAVRPQRPGLQVDRRHRSIGEDGPLLGQVLARRHAGAVGACGCRSMLMGIGNSRRSRAVSTLGRQKVSKTVIFFIQSFGSSCSRSPGRRNSACSAGPSSSPSWSGTPLSSTSPRPDRPSPAVGLYAKAEFANPGGSVKDRPGKAMVEDAVRRGLLGPGKRILDSTSGNTGIAYAWLGAAMGIPVTLCLPSNASPERKRILAAYGVELHLTDPLAGLATAPSSRPGGWRPSGPTSTSTSTSTRTPRTGGRTIARPAPRSGSRPAAAVTHFITGLGTSGTFVGRRAVPARAGAPGPADLGRAGQSRSRARGHEAHGDGDRAADLRPGARRRGARAAPPRRRTRWCERLAREAGLMVGVSSGCNVAAALAPGARRRRTAR